MGGGVHKIGGTHSSIVGGYYNTASGCYSFIGNGLGNSSCGAFMGDIVNGILNAQAETQDGLPLYACGTYCSSGGMDYIYFNCALDSSFALGNEVFVYDQTQQFLSCNVICTSISSGPGDTCIQIFEFTLTPGDNYLLRSETSYCTGPGTTCCFNTIVNGVANSVSGCYQLMGTGYNSISSGCYTNVINGFNNNMCHSNTSNIVNGMGNTSFYAFGSDIINGAVNTQGSAVPGTALYACGTGVAGNISVACDLTGLMASLDHVTVYDKTGFNLQGCACINAITYGATTTFNLIGGSIINGHEYVVRDDSNFNSVSGTYCNFNTIANGIGNSSSGCYNFIGNGSLNTISGNYSAILGGSGNNIPAGCSYVGVFGCNITTVCNSAFHVNSLVAQDIPLSGNPATCAPPTGAPSGTLYYVPVGFMRQVWVTP